MFYDRRAARGSRRMPGRRGKTLFQLVLALAAGRPVFTADYYAIDGVSGKVASFIDWNDPTHMLAQAVSGNQVALPAGHADFAGKLCASFTGVEWYRSTRSAAYWGITADGVSLEYFLTYTPVNTTVRLATLTGTSGAGIQVYAGGGNENALFNNGAVGVIVGSTGVSLGASANGTSTYVDVRCELAGSPQYEARRKGSLVSSGAYANAPPAGGSPAFGSLVLGARNGATPDFNGQFRWRNLLFMPALSAAQRSTVQQYIQADTGIAP